MRSTVLPLDSRYRGALYGALFQQVPCALLCLLMLDGGRMARICGIAMVGFWAVAAIIMVRRPSAPGAWDLRFLRWGFWPVFGLAVLMAQLVSE